MPCPSLLLALVPLLLLFPTGLQESSDLRDLVRRLGSDSAQERDSARKKLKEAGRLAAPVLEAFVQDRDPEVAARARELLRVLEVAQSLSPGLRAVLPGVEDRLATGGDATWTKAFLEAVERDPKTWARLHPTLKRADLEPLVARALRGAENSAEFVSICMFLNLHSWPTAVPELAKRLGEPNTARFAVMVLTYTPFPSTVQALLPVLTDGSPGARASAAEVLGALRLPECGPPLLGLLKDPDPGVKQKAIVSLGKLRYRPAGEALRRLLGQRDFELDVLYALGRIGCKEAANDISSYLENRSPTCRARAAEALAELGCKEAAPKIEKLLVSNGDPLPIGALGRLGYAEAIPTIRRYVQDPSVSVRAYSIAALGALGDRSSAKLLVPALDERDVGVAQSARQVLRDWNATELVPDISALLSVRREDAFLGEAGATLADLGAPESIPAVRPLLRSKFPYVRAIGAELLSRMGSDEGVDLLLEDQEHRPLLTGLNALRRPEAYGRLVRERLRQDPEGLPLDVARSVAEQMGVTLVLSKEFQEECIPEAMLTYFEVPWTWPSPRPLEFLNFAAGNTYGEVILEDKAIRLVSRTEGLAFWRAWQADRKR